MPIKEEKNDKALQGGSQNVKASKDLRDPETPRARFSLNLLLIQTDYLKCTELVLLLIITHDCHISNMQILYG